MGWNFHRLIGAITIVSVAGLVSPKPSNDIKKAKPPHTHVEDYLYRPIGESNQVTVTTSTGTITPNATSATVRITPPTHTTSYTSRSG